MIYGQVLLRPAAAEVRSMLHKIKLDNMERARNTAANAVAMQLQDSSMPRDLPKKRFTVQPIQEIMKRFRSVPQRKVSQPDLDQMGSFTSMPKVIPSKDSEDTDVDYPTGREDIKTCLKRCSEQLANLPPPIERKWRSIGDGGDAEQGEKIRVLQWNALSQALGTKNDNFVRCPPAALDWRTRRFRLLEEIARHDADVVCLQEVDHFNFLRLSLSALGYDGHFCPKPDSPCLYLPENAGPDGCAVFYKRDRFDLKKVEQRVVEVWHVESNQVVLLTCLRSKQTDEDIYVATTHLKARQGALLSTLRNEQGKDVVEFISGQVNQGHQQQGQQLLQAPVICAGDFNAEPTEPVYKTMTDNKLGLKSAYSAASASGREPAYTTWKIREDGEHVQTLDYIFHTRDRLRVDAVLEFPTGDDLGEGRVPSLAYASDHFSLVADFTVIPSKKSEEK